MSLPENSVSGLKERAALMDAVNGGSKQRLEFQCQVELKNGVVAEGRPTYYNT